MKFINMGRYYFEYHLSDILPLFAYEALKHANFLNVNDFFKTESLLSKINKKTLFSKKRKTDNGMFAFYELRVFNDYYEFNHYGDIENNLCLLFDKPVRITGKYCHQIIAPEIIISDNNKVQTIYNCIIENKAVVKNDKILFLNSYIKRLVIENNFIWLKNSKIERISIENENMVFSDESSFVDDFVIKCFGKCEDLKNKRIYYNKFEKGTIQYE